MPTAALQIVARSASRSKNSADIPGASAEFIRLAFIFCVLVGGTSSLPVNLDLR